MSTGKHSKTTFFIKSFTLALEGSGLTKKQVSEKTGIFAGRLSEYALGKTDPSFQNIIKIANCFGLTLSAFFALADEDESLQSAPQPTTETQELLTSYKRNIELQDDLIVNLRAENTRLKAENARLKALLGNVDEPVGEAGVPPAQTQNALGAVKN